MKKIILILLVINISLFSSEVLNYKVENKSILFDKNRYTILRSFEMQNEKFYLLTNEKTLKTTIIKQEDISTFKVNKIKNSRYYTLLEKYHQEPYVLQNYGVKSLKSKNTYLSVDMCPSSKISYEKEFYKNLASVQNKMPLTIFITGKWIKIHENDFKELINYQKTNKLDITWGNHSFTHFYDSSKALEENFLNAPNTNVRNEILELEKLLISYGVTPSILFRFPGLVSNENTVNEVNKLGLIPVGSNAWLAKGEKAEKGSIVLVHGNKNEHKGIELSKQMFEKKDLIFGKLLDDL